MTAHPEARQKRTDVKWGKTTIFFVFHLHLFGGLVMLQNLTDSLFFSTAGVEALPTVRFGLAAVMLPLTLAYDRFSARDHTNRVFAPLIVLCGMLIVLLAVFRHFEPMLGGYALMIATPIVQAFLLAEFWNFANRYFTIRESKRAFPQLFAAASLGGVAAGFATSTLAPLTGTANLLLVWLVLELLSLTFIRAIRRNVTAPHAISPTRTRPRPVLGAKRRPGLWQRLRRSVVNQPLVTGIVGLSFIGAVVLFLAEYAYFDIFAKAYPNTDDLTEFLGLWTAGSSGVNFALSFFLLPRAATWLGVRNVTLAQPILAIIVFISLIAVPTLAIGVLAMLAIQSRNVIEETNEKFLYKGLPPELSQIVRGRSEGAVKPIAAAFAAALQYGFGSPDSVLMASVGAIGSPLGVSIAGLFIAVTYVGVALVARYAYPRAIVERIRTRTFDLSSEGFDAFIEGGESRALLEEQLASDDTELVRFAAEYLYSAEPDAALAAVEGRLASADPALAADLLMLIARWAPDGSPRLRDCAAPFLDHDDERVRAGALSVWASLPDTEMGPVLAALSDVSLNVRREAVAALCLHWDLMMVARGAEELDALMRGELSSSRMGAVDVLGRLNDRRHLRMLVPMLEDTERKVRIHTAKTLRDRVDESCSFVVDDLVRYLASCDHMVRLNLVDALLRIGSPRAGQAVLAAGDAVPSSLRNRSARFLASHADDNVEFLESTLASPAHRHGERILAAKALSLAGRRFRDFLAGVARDELTEAYRTLRDGHLLMRAESFDTDTSARTDALELLLLALADRRREALEIVIEIVGFASQHPEFDTIRAYCFSSDPVARAYAIEALEGLADRALFELLLPFLTIDPADELEHALGGIGTQLGLHRQDDDVLGRRLEDAQPWVRACALFAASQFAHAGAAEAAIRYRDDPDPIVRETAEWARARSV